MEDLQSWYKKELKRVRRISWYIKISLLLLIIIQFFRPLYVFLLILLSSRSSNLKNLFYDYTHEKEFSFILIFNELIILSLGLLVVLAYKKRKTTFQNQIKKGKLKKLYLEKVPELNELIQTLGNRMGVSIRDMTVYVSSQKSFLPSIESQKSLYAFEYFALVLPMNFFVLLKRNPKMCEGLIAHEFAHILHQDTYLWHFSSIFSKVVKMVIMPFHALQLILVLPTLVVSILTSSPFPTVSLSLSSLCLGISYTGYRSCMIGRRKSEELADALAIIFTDGNQLVEALQSLLIEKRDYGAHPSKSERIHSIKNKLESINTQKVKL